VFQTWCAIDSFSYIEGCFIAAEENTSVGIDLVRYDPQISAMSSPISDEVTGQRQCYIVAVLNNAFEIWHESLKAPTLEITLEIIQFHKLLIPELLPFRHDPLF
jgi:hypothetical protein